jgi:hypothetical protein
LVRTAGENGRTGAPATVRNSGAGCAEAHAPRRLRPTRVRYRIGLRLRESPPRYAEAAAAI